MALTIGITLGDVTGIGPEVTLKALAAELEFDDTHYVLVGDARWLSSLNQRLDLNIQTCSSRKDNGKVSISDPRSAPLPAELPVGSPEAARAALEYLRTGAQRSLQHEFDALVTAPVNKETIIRAGISFIGQTEFLSELAGTRQTAMMLLGQNEAGRWLRVVLVTTHLPLRMVAEQLTSQKVELAIERASDACRALHLPRARIGVCGLNPHAGEGGLLGDEEQTTIRPAVLAMQNRQIDVVGPLSADALFYSAFNGDYDVVVAMYHDQGLAPLKMVAFAEGVNWTLGLPFIRTSPDHGTAYDIAGHGKAAASSMLAAIRLAKQLARGKMKELHHAV